MSARGGSRRAVVVLALAAAVVLGVVLLWSPGSGPPTVRLEAGVHRGPLVLDRAQTLVGRPGATVRGGILVRADGVTVRGVAVSGGEHGIDVDGASDVRLEDVTVSGAALDGIHVRRSSVTIRNCRVSAPSSPFGQGIDLSFAFDLEPSVVEGCTVTGGQEGIVTHSVDVHLRDNRVSGTSLRAITVTEMSKGVVEGNKINDALGVGVYCGDYSHCEIARNTIAGTRPDAASGDRSRLGYPIVAVFGARARLDGNTIVGSRREVGVFSQASVTHKR